MIAQTAPQITHYVRQGDSWQRFDYGDLKAVIELSSLQITLPLSEVYAGIEFS